MGKAILYAASLAIIQLLGGCDRQADTPRAAQPEASERPAAPPEEPQARTDTALILAFGDSLYAGYGLDFGEGLAPELQRQLKDRGVTARVVNGGVSGDTSAAGRARLGFTLDGLPRKPDLVLVGLGGNDMLRGVDPSETRANLVAILDELQRREIPAMLTGMLAPPNLGEEYRTEFDSIYPDLAERYDIPLDRFFLEGALGRRGLMLPDGIHPSAAGIDLIAQRLAPQVEDALPDPAPSGGPG